MIRFKVVTIAHVGDTKAFMFKKQPFGVGAFGKKEIAVLMTEDHVAANVNERKRIYNSYGEIRKSADLTQRVYARGRNYPGLHLTRSIGDLIA